MSTPWHAIRNHLMLSASTHSFQGKFEALRHARQPLYRYLDPVALLDALHRGADTFDEKNRILTALVEAAQSNEAPADCALTLMLLVLWPGLDGVLRRSRWRRLSAEDELPSEVLTRATEAIRCLDLGRVNRIAATILMNIERDLFRAQQRQARTQNLFADIALDEVGTVRGAPDPISREGLLRETTRTIGAAASNLVIRVAVDGYSQAEVGRELGLTEAAARKRYQRATGRLRYVLQDSF